MATAACNAGVLEYMLEGLWFQLSHLLKAGNTVQ